MNRNNSPTSADDSRTEPDWLAIVREKTGSLRYGDIRITVHEGRVTQVERTERVRLENSPAR